VSWFTELPIEKHSWIHKDSSLFFLGSCFSENIGSSIVDAHFKGCVNPFGTVYNPISAGKQLELFIQRNYSVKDEAIHFQNELYHTWDHHTLLSHPDKEVFKKQLNERQQEAHNMLTSNNLVVIWTLGTNKVYFRNGESVANCHKYPSSDFTTKFLTVEESYDALQRGWEMICHVNPKAKLMLTVSPVKYIRDGLRQSLLGKSTLLLATKKMEDNYQNISYFPAYEIQTEELRDYRFYATDLAHPSEETIQHIEGKFIESYFQDSAVEKLGHWDKIKRMMEHKIRFPETKSASDFESKLEHLKTQFFTLYGSQN
jgi:hypothetical protein